MTPDGVRHLLQRRPNLKELDLGKLEEEEEEVEEAKKFMKEFPNVRMY